MLKRILLVLLIGVVAALVALPMLRDPAEGPIGPADRAGRRGELLALPAGGTWIERAGPPQGEPVVLVHGFSVPAYVWDPTFAALADAGFRVVRYDLFGRGLSDRPAGRYDLAFFRAQLDGMLDAASPERPAHLVGLSMGAAVVADYAAVRPERVARVALFDPFNTPRDIGLLARPLIGEWLFRVRVLPGLADGQLRDFVAPAQFPDWADRYREQMRRDGFAAALLATLRHTIAVDPLPAFVALGAQDRPILLVWGEQDRTTPYEQAARVRAVLPRAGFLSVPEAGHLPHLERPRYVHPVLVEFLRR